MGAKFRKLAPSAGEVIVTPTLATKTLTTPEVQLKPRLSTATTNRLFDPAGALLATALNGASVSVANKVSPRKKSTRVAGGFRKLVLMLVVTGIGSPTVKTMPLVGESSVTPPGPWMLSTMLPVAAR